MATNVINIREFVDVSTSVAATPVNVARDWGALLFVQKGTDGAATTITTYDNLQDLMAAASNSEAAKAATVFYGTGYKGVTPASPITVAIISASSASDFTTNFSALLTSEAYYGIVLDTNFTADMQKAAAASGKNARQRSSPIGIQTKSQKPNRRRKNLAAARSGQDPGSATTHSARRATTTAAPGAAPSAASARNANLPASRGGRSSKFEGSIKMAGIMGLFASELDEFVADYDNQFWDASFHGETYPPRIIMERSTPPL